MIERETLQASRRYRVAALVTHPIQYIAPLLRKLAEHPRLDVTAYYGSDQGVSRRLDPEFGVSFEWDVPLLEGYQSKFLRNYSWKRVAGGFWWVISPGIIRELFRGRYDAVIIHGYASATSWLGYLGAWLTRTPVLFRAETLLRQQVGWKRAAKTLGLRWLFRRTAALLAIGQKSEEFYRAYGVPETKIFLTPYCVDNELFMAQAEAGRAERERTRASLGFPGDLPVALYSGKLIPRKRPQDVIEAVSRLGSAVGILLVGDGLLRPALEAEVRERGLPFVRFVGFQNQRELQRFYAAADIFVFPSAFEPYGLVVNEAMCAGLPVLTTPAVAASADLVREGENGFLFPVGDVETLARRIQQLFEDPTLRKAMGERSRKIIAGWNYHACVAGILGALDRVVSEQKRSRQIC